jgi:AcrR family transcriptional regulator
MTTAKKAPRRAPVQRRARATVESILDAAARVFADHGYAAGTTNRIATEAGVSVGSLYEYFPNKDSVLAALLERRLAEAAQDLDLALADLGGSAAPAHVALDRLIAAVVDRFRSAPMLDRVLFEEVPHPPAARLSLAAAEGALADRVRGILLRLPGVQVDPAGPAALLTARALESLVRSWVFHGFPGLDEDAFKVELARMLGGYLGLRSRAPQLGIGGAAAW